MTTRAHRTKRAWARSATARGAPVLDERSPQHREPLATRRSAESAIHAALTTRGRYPHCDCGQPADRLALFHQLTADCRYRYLNALPVCEVCADAFVDAEQILTMEEAYAMVHLPVPASTQFGRPERRPAPPTHCGADGNAGAK